MSMKWLNSKGILILFLCLLSLQVFSRNKPDFENDSILIENNITHTKYDERVDKYYKRWTRLIPRYHKIQYAGSMGLLSIGPGWDYAKHWETDVFIGFIPKYSTDKTKITLTLKQNYIPWKKDLNEKFMFEPLHTGMYVNTVFGGDFWMSEPDRYPSGYYSFSTKIRFNIFVGQRITYNIKSQKRFFAKSITFFYEINTSDLYLASAVPNKYLKPKDYLGLSFGLKMQIL